VPDAADPDIFDDTDFYQKMLRDMTRLLTPVEIALAARTGWYWKSKRKQRRR